MFGFPFYRSTYYNYQPYRRRYNDFGRQNLYNTNNSSTTSQKADSPSQNYNQKNYREHITQNNPKVQNYQNSSVPALSKCEADNIKSSKTLETSASKRSPKHNSFANINISNLFSSNLDEPVLEIFGISLYLDDLLIIGLLFCLYTEGVKDEMLFICLILLLLG